jgi:excisionase family DNA binding protein
MRKISIARRRLDLVGGSQSPTTAELRSLRREGPRMPPAPRPGSKSTGATLAFPITEADAQALESMASRKEPHQLTATLRRNGPLLVLKLEPPLDGKRLLSSDQVSEVLGVSRPYVYHLARAGKLPGYRMGRILRFEPGDVLDFLSNCRYRAGGKSCT